MEYDFKSLFDYDFELLCCDLLSALLKKRIENFRRGKDLGICDMPERLKGELLFSVSILLIRLFLVFIALWLKNIPKLRSLILSAIC